MAFNSSTNKVATKSLVKVLETVVTGRLVIEDENTIDRTLGGMGRVHIVSEDRLGDAVQIAGSVNFTALYTQGDKSITSGQMFIDFIERVDMQGVENLAYVPAIKSYKVSKESDKSLVVNIIVETKIYGVKSEEISILVGEEEGYYTETKNVIVNNLSASATTSFSVSDTLDIGDGKVLGISAKTIATKVVPFDNYATIEGQCLLDVLTSTQEQIKSIQKTVNFTEEVPVLNLSSNAVVDFCLMDKSLTFTTEPTDENLSKIIVDVGIGVSIWGFVPTEVCVVTDAFSDIKVTDLTYSQFASPQELPVKFASDRKTITIDVENKKRIDEVLYVGQACTKVEEARVEDGFLQTKGKVNVPVIFKNYDSDEVMSFILEESFELGCEVEQAGEEIFVDVVVAANVNNFKNKAGKDISFVLDFDYVVSSRVFTTETYVSKIEEVENITATKSEIVVYKPNKEETVFDIAKILQISPDVLRLQNPQIEDGKEISQVVVYKRSK